MALSWCQNALSGLAVHEWSPAIHRPSLHLQGLVALGHFNDFDDKCQHCDISHNAGSDLGNKLPDCSRINDLHQLISEPTGVTGRISQ